VVGSARLVAEGRDERLPIIIAARKSLSIPVLKEKFGKKAAALGTTDFFRLLAAALGTTDFFRLLVRLGG